MWIDGQEYTEELKRALHSTGEASVAIAFWGKGAAKELFHGWRGRPLRILCNLEYGGTNPAVMRELKALRGAQVRQLSALHAKVVITDSQVIVGSANASANGLGYEGGELTGWHEAGMVNKDTKVRADAVAWFEERWEAARKIEKADLDAAGERWKARRKGRAIPNAKGLLEQTAESQRDGRFHLLIWRAGLSQTAIDRLEAAKQTQDDMAGNNAVSNLDLYESKAEERSEVFDDPHALLIPVYYGRRGAIRVDETNRPLPDLADTYTAEGQTLHLDFVATVQDEALLQFIGTKEANAAWVDALKPWLEFHREQGTVEQIVPLSDFLEWRETRKLDR